MRFIPLLVIAVFAVSCVAAPANVSATSSDSPLVGTWSQREAVSGTTFVLTLKVQDTAVTGTGTYSIEGGRSGSLTEKGSVSKDGTLQLDITYDDGSLAQFNGQASSANVLSGALHFGSPQSLTPSAIVAFDKKS